VAEYQGDLEIVPQIPSDVTVLATSERIVADRRLGELGKDDLGRLVGVEGVLRSLLAFSAGLKGVLDDGTGVVTLLLWQDVCDELPEPSLVVPGAVLHVEGVVREYGGELEIVPEVPADIEVVGMVDLPLEDRAIGQIMADDVGHTVQLEGWVSEASASSKGMKYTMDDGTGTITPTIEHTDVIRDTPEPASEPTVASVAERLKPTLAPMPSPTPSPAPTPSPEVRAIGDLSKGNVGRVFTIAQSGIAEVDYFSREVLSQIVHPRCHLSHPRA
jgi:hypothetical protein